MKILICGYGNIGKHIFKEFEKLKDDIVIYDKYQKDYSDDSILDSFYDFAFVSVPTEMNEDGSCNVEEVKWIVPKIKAGVIIIKSAVPVGTCESFYLPVPNVVISPEYYGTTQHSLESPNFVVLGGSRIFTNKVAELYGKIKDGSFRCIFTNWRTAELAKYMENCWIATKVTFCNEFAKIADAYDINYPELRECFIADERVSPSHTFVYPDKPYYDSHCLNKDIPALIRQCDFSHIETPLMDSIHSINMQLKGK